MKSAIVTGGAGGIGRVICQELARQGYAVGVFDKDGDAAREVASTLDKAVGIAVDATDETSVADAMARFGGIPDVLVNNAGMTRPGGMKQPVAVFRQILEVNLVSAYLMCQAVADGMVARRSGVIINITSTGASAAIPAVGAYGPSKAALTNLTKALALEYGPHGIRVNAVAPGLINAGQGARYENDPELYQTRVAQVSLGRLGSALDVASVVAFLASDAAAYVHGQEIIVDGGLTTATLLRALPR
jgi:NAD(P)-dependent dehydrogenase (short-subunit alcohol dehydrogenase family)